MSKALAIKAVENIVNQELEIRNYEFVTKTLAALSVLIAAVSYDEGIVRATVAQDPPITLAPRVGRRESPAQPQQRQGVEYFAGSWTFTWTGRESDITSGPRSGVATFTRQGTGYALALVVEGKTDAGPAFKETGSYEWNESSKTMAIAEKLAGGLELRGTGDWSSPLSIRFESAPVKAGGQSLKVRRTYNILSAVSFNVVEELSTNDGPYQRLGNGQFVRR